MSPLRCSSINSVKMSNSWSRSPPRRRRWLASITRTFSGCYSMRYIVMEYVHGESLHDAAWNHGQSPPRCDLAQGDPHQSRHALFEHQGDGLQPRKVVPSEARVKNFSSSRAAAYFQSPGLYPQSNQWPQGWRWRHRQTLHYRYFRHRPRLHLPASPRKQAGNQDSDREGQSDFI